MANPRLSRSYYLRTSDFDPSSRLKPSAVLDLFQDVAGLHADILGIGRVKMMERGLIWVVTRVRYEVVKTPEMYDEVKVTTWPLSPEKIIFERDYSIESADGDLLVRGSSEWVCMDVETRKYSSRPDAFIYDETEGEIRSFPDKAKKIRDFEPDDSECVIVPAYSDLDLNGHVNNIRYAEFAVNAMKLEKGEFVEKFQIDYHREVQTGIKLCLYKRRDEDNIVLKGVSSEGELMFSCLARIGRI